MWRRNANLQPLFGYGLIVAVLFWLVGQPVSALDVSVSARVIDTTTPPANPVVQFRGRASPRTTIDVHLDSTVTPPTLSVQTDPAAKFDITLSNQPTGQHVYTIEANDTDGRPHASLSFALNLAAGSTTVITGVFLGPTIDIDKQEVKLGEPVTVFGKTAPSSSVMVTVSSTPRTYNVLADANGSWSKVIQSNDVGVGSHSVTAEAVSTDQTISEASQAVTFSVNPLAPCDGKPTADLNCDGQVNLTDFSILLYFWLDTNPSNSRADINRDGRVTIVDFSIMLYQWTG